MCLQFVILHRHLGRRTRHGLVYFDGKSERNFTIMHFGYHRLGDMTVRMRKVMARPWVVAFIIFFIICITVDKPVSPCK